jgi:hypothetical protein
VGLFDAALQSLTLRKRARPPPEIAVTSLVFPIQTPPSSDFASSKKYYFSTKSLFDAHFATVAPFFRETGANNALGKSEFCGGFFSRRLQRIGDRAGHATRGISGAEGEPHYRPKGIGGDGAQEIETGTGALHMGAEHRRLVRQCEP